MTTTATTTGGSLGSPEAVQSAAAPMPTHISLVVRAVLDRALAMSQEPSRVARRAQPVKRPRRAVAGAAG
jgi:hypothetical protein